MPWLEESSPWSDLVSGGISPQPTLCLTSFPPFCALGTLFSEVRLSQSGDPWEKGPVLRALVPGQCLVSAAADLTSVLSREGPLGNVPAAQEFQGTFTAPHGGPPSAPCQGAKGALCRSGPLLEGPTTLFLSSGSAGAQDTWGCALITSGLRAWLPLLGLVLNMAFASPMPEGIHSLRGGHGCRRGWGTVSPPIWKQKEGPSGEPGHPPTHTHTKQNHTSLGRD